MGFKTEEIFKKLRVFNYTVGTKTIDLIVLEDGQAKRVPLAEFTLDHLPQRSTVNKYGPLEKEVLRINDETYTCEILLQLYLKPLLKVQQLFSNLLKDTPQEEKASYENITAVPFAFASADAYNTIKPAIQKEKDGDAKIDVVGHFDDYGIVVSLCEEPKYIRSTVAHEHGHYMHQNLCPEKYLKCTPTMKEFIAIFVQEMCGYNKSYVENTMHHRAKQLLCELQKTEHYRQIPVSEQWKLINNFRKHRNLRRYIEICFK